MQTILITGASGLVGNAAVQAFADAGWRVIALSRRAPDIAHPNVDHLALDLRDAAACRAAIAARPGISHLAYAAVHETPGLVAGWFDPAIMRVNLGMLENVLQPLLAEGSLEHVSILQGGKAYGAHLHPVPLPAREDGPRDPHENFYWLQEDATRAAAASHGIRFTVLRPPLIVGGATGAVMNVLIPIAVHAVLCRETGEPFGFTGGVTKPFDMVDSRVVAAALLWAADAPEASNQLFNVDNGEVGDWRPLWPTIAEALGVTPAADRPLKLADRLIEQAPRWRAIAERHGLVEPDMAALMGESHHYADMLFGPGVTDPAPPFAMSTVKIRRAGFTTYMDNRETFRFWIDDLVRRRIISPA